jgi:hypothetical protein
VSEANKPLLDLDTLEPSRPTVRIRTKTSRKGKLYEIVGLDELSLREKARLARLQVRIDELRPAVAPLLLGQDDAVDEDALAGFEEAVDGFLGLVYRGLEERVISAMRFGQKEALLGAFIEASPPELREAMAQAMQAQASAMTNGETSDSSSPDSSASTEASPVAG